MRHSLGPADIASDVRLMRSLHKGAFCLVEGETADLRTYERFIDAEACQIIVTHGKDNATGALEILEGSGFEGVLAIVDSDFWRIQGEKPKSPNLFVTDTHDLETMIFKASAASKLMTEFGSRDKIERFVQENGKAVYEALLASAQPIGYLRYVSQQRNLGLTFQELPFGTFVDGTTLSTDVPSLIRAVKNKSRKPELLDDDLRAAIEEEIDVAHDPWDVCCGHDLVRIMSVGLRSRLGSNNAREVEPELLEKVLRIAYESSHFFDTRLFEALRSWEAANKPFRIFPQS